MERKDFELEDKNPLNNRNKNESYMKMSQFLNEKRKLLDKLENGAREVWRRVSR